MAPDVWSVLVGVFDEEPVAIGWATTFRLDLAERVSAFTLDQPLSVQVGRVLLDHVRPGLDPGADELPPTSACLTPDETLRSLPASLRLRYLVDLFFHVSEHGPADVAVLRLMEPGLHTDARRTAQSLLQRFPPDEVLLHPPGVVPPPRPSRLLTYLTVSAGMLVATLTVAALVLAILGRPRHLDWASAAGRHVGLVSAPRDVAHGVFVGFDPSVLSLALIRGGARVTLVDLPDLAPEHLTLLAATDLAPGTDDETVTAIYATATGADLLTLQHTLAQLPSDATAPDGRVADHHVDSVDLAGWTEAGGAWVLAGSNDAGDLATHIRDRRRASGPP